MKKLRKVLINIFIVCVTSGIIIEMILNDYSEKEIKEQIEYNTQILGFRTDEKTDEIQEKEIESREEKKQEDILENKEKIIEEYKGYRVIAKLEIPIINLETYVLQEYSNNSLNISVTKFWGANPNEKGNFCIAGHNFQNKNMFHNLSKLKKGDSIFITDNKKGKLEYNVYNVYKVLPENVSCLSQETNGKTEVTLITCTNDSKKRIIIKARAIYEI